MRLLAPLFGFFVVHCVPFLQHASLLAMPAVSDLVFHGSAALLVLVHALISGILFLLASLRCLMALGEIIPTSSGLAIRLVTNLPLLAAFLLMFLPVWQTYPIQLGRTIQLATWTTQILSVLRLVDGTQTYQTKLKSHCTKITQG